MEVPHIEGLATRNGPESCAGDGNVVGEALTGGAWAELLSRESNELQSADDVRRTEGNTEQVVMARPVRALRGPWNSARAQAPRTGIGRSRCWPGRRRIGSAQRTERARL